MAKQFQCLSSFDLGSRNQNIVNPYEQSTESVYSAQTLDNSTNSNKDILAKIENLINDITKSEFHIKWPLLKIDYYSEKHSALRQWFEVIDFELREQIKKEWIADMKRLRVSLPFFLWFPTFTSKYGLPDAYSQPSLHVQTTLFKVWHFTKGGSVSAIHPPVSDLKFQQDGVSYLATPFRQGRTGDGTATYSDVQKIHQQLNYTNTAISTLAGQLNHVATRMDDIQTPIPNSTANYANSISKPFFKVDSVSRKDQEDFTTAFSNTMLLNQITQQLKALSIDSPSTSCIDKTCVQNQNIETESEDSEHEDEEITNIALNFEEENALAINKINYENISTTRNYYTKPTPPDLQFEERGTFATNHFDGQSIYTWNIDGKSEHEILSTLQEMTMAMTAYRTKGLDSKTQAIAIINGFQGQLKYWWDNFLTEEEYNRILEFKRVVRNSNGIEVEASAQITSKIWCG